MKQAIIKINDFKGGMVANENQGAPDQFSHGQQLDFLTKPGSLAPNFAWKNVQLSASDDVTTRMLSIFAASNRALYFGGADTKLYTGINALSVARDSGQAGSIAGLGEHAGKFYYLQNTTIGQFDLSSSFNDTWQSSLASFLGIKPVHASSDQKIYFGRGRYIAQYNGVTFTEQKLDLTADWVCADIDDFGTFYLAIAVNDSADTASEFSGRSQRSKILLWDKISAQWQDEISIPEPEIRAIQFSGGYLWIFAGRTSNIYVVPVGSRTVTLIKQFYLPEPTAEFDVNPYAVIASNGRIFFGLSRLDSLTATGSVPAGVYSFPQDPRQFALNLEFSTNELSPSEGTRSRFDTVAALTAASSGNPFGQLACSYTRTFGGEEEHVFSQAIASGDDVGYYKDVTYYESFKFEAPQDKLIFAEAFGITMEALPSGCNITLQYKRDDDSSWTDVITDFSTANATQKIVNKPLDGVELLQLRLLIRGSTTADSVNRPFIKSIFVTGELKDRINY